MVTYGQNKLNKNEVRAGIFRFLLTFMVLTCTSFLCVFLFYKSSENQTKQTKIKANQYLSLDDKVYKLNVKLDRIRTSLESLNYGTESNYSNTSKMVTEDIKDCKKIIASDTADLKAYVGLLKQIEKNILPNKRYILSSNDKVIKANNKLADCEKTQKKLSTPKLSKLQQQYGK